MKNHRIVLIMRIIKHILGEFVNLFVSMYLINISNGRIDTVVKYNIIVVITTFLFLFGTGSIAKSNRRILLLWSGIILNVVYFATVALMGQSVVEYYYIPGLVMGMSEGLYWSCFNLLNAEGIENSNRRNFIGVYTVVKGAAGILFPILIGKTIYGMGFRTGIVFVGVLSFVNAILGIIYKDKKQENNGDYHPILMFRHMRGDTQIKRIFLWHFFTGMTYSSGAFSVAVTVFMLRIVGNSMKAGWMAGALSLLSCITGFLFSRFFRTSHRQQSISILACICLVVSTFFIVFSPNPVAVSLFYFAFGFYKDISSSVDALICDGYANASVFVRTHKTEYYALNDTSLIIGRVAGFVLLYLYSCTMSSLLLLLFLVPVVIAGIIFHKCLGHTDGVEKDNVTKRHVNLCFPGKFHPIR